MTTETQQPKGNLFRRWIGATTLGWLVGFALVLALAMVWDTIGGHAQFMVGVGMGAGVGFMQARVAVAWTGQSRAWLWTSIIGMGVPFVLWDIGSMMGLKAAWSLPVCVLLGGLLTGVLQQGLLRPRFERAPWWVPACVVGWGLPAGVIALGDSGRLPEVFGVVSTAVLFFGGVLLGAVTGKTLQWMSSSEADAPRMQPPGVASD